MGYRAVLCATHPVRQASGWDVFLLTDGISGRAARFPVDGSNCNFPADSDWHGAGEDNLSQIEQMVLREMRPLIEVFGRRVMWRLIGMTHADPDSSCLVQLRVPRPNSLPEVVHERVELEPVAAGPRQNFRWNERRPRSRFPFQDVS